MLETATGPWKTFRIECIQYVYNTTCQNLSLKWIEALQGLERGCTIGQCLLWDYLWQHVASWIRTRVTQVSTKLQYALYLKIFPMPHQMKVFKCGFILFHQQMHCKWLDISRSLCFQHNPLAQAIPQAKLEHSSQWQALRRVELVGRHTQSLKTVPLDYWGMSASSRP